MESTYHPILHIEDEENDIALVQRAFTSAGISHPIQVVKNGSLALDYLSERGRFEDRNYYPLPSLILLDLTMPVMSGLELLKWRQSQPSIRRIPVIVLTSSPQPQDVLAAYDSGANGYLVKPASFPALVEMLKAIHSYWLIHNTYTTTGLPTDEVSMGIRICSQEGYASMANTVLPRLFG